MFGTEKDGRCHDDRAGTGGGLQAVQPVRKIGGFVYVIDDRLAFGGQLHGHQNPQSANLDVGDWRRFDDGDCLAAVRHKL